MASASGAATGRSDGSDPRLQARIVQAAVGVTGAVVVTADLDGRICYFNAAAERLTGYSAAEVVGRSIVDALLPPEDADGARAAFARLAAGRVPTRYESDWVTRDGERRHLAFATAPLLDDDGRVTHLVGTGIDVTAERDARRLIEAVLGATTEQAIIATDRSGRIAVFNAGAERMLGHSAEEAVGQDLAELLHVREEMVQRTADLGVPVESVVRAPGRDGGAETRHWTLRRRDGSTLVVALSVTPLRAPGGEVQGYVGVAVDATAQKAREEQLHRAAELAAHRAAHDPLTGLANRSVLLERLQAALSARRRSDGRTALLFLDVDGLKQVNDRHGHAAGDALLVVVARRLAAASRDGDLCVRLGGDEFAVLLDDLADAPELEAVASRVSTQLSEPLRLPDGTVTVPQASLGTAVLQPGDSCESLLERADAAMYAVKTSRRAPSA